MLNNISNGAKYFCFIKKYVLHAIIVYYLLVAQMQILINNFSGKVIIINVGIDMFTH